METSATIDNASAGKAPSPKRTKISETNDDDASQLMITHPLPREASNITVIEAVGRDKSTQKSQKQEIKPDFAPPSTPGKFMGPPASRERGSKHVALVHYGREDYTVIDALPGHEKKAAMIHQLIDSFGLLKHVVILAPGRATPTDLQEYHTEEYVKALRAVDARGADGVKEEVLEEYGLQNDCSPFQGLWDYISMVVGSTLRAARFLTDYTKEYPPTNEGRYLPGTAPIAIHWLGGRHHAKKDEASGFCFVNDAVLAILKLSRAFGKVLYIDVDIHHGDGVEEAFYYSREVITLSFHQYEPGFFPGTGKLTDVGAGKAKNHTINVPLREGITDAEYVPLFERIVQELDTKWRPSCIVMVCGADVLDGDPLGGFCVTLQGIQACLKFVLSLNKPLLLLGGGGYHMPSVARMTAVLTAAACGVSLPPRVPKHPNSLAYSDHNTFYLPKTHLENKNTFEFIEEVEEFALNCIAKLTT